MLNGTKKMDARVKRESYAAICISIDSYIYIYIYLSKYIYIYHVWITYIETHIFTTNVNISLGNQGFFW